MHLTTHEVINASIIKCKTDHYCELFNPIWKQIRSLINDTANLNLSIDFGNGLYLRVLEITARIVCTLTYDCDEGDIQGRDDCFITFIAYRESIDVGIQGISGDSSHILDTINDVVKGFGVDKLVPAKNRMF